MSVIWPTPWWFDKLTMRALGPSEPLGAPVEPRGPALTTACIRIHGETSRMREDWSRPPRFIGAAVVRCVDAGMQTRAWAWEGQIRTHSGAAFLFGAEEQPLLRPWRAHRGLAYRALRACSEAATPASLPA